MFDIAVAEQVAARVLESQLEESERFARAAGNFDLAVMSQNAALALRSDPKPSRCTWDDHGLRGACSWDYPHPTLPAFCTPPFPDPYTLEYMRGVELSRQVGWL